MNFSISSVSKVICQCISLRGLSLVLLVAFLLVAGSTPASGYGWFYNGQQEIQDRADWMSQFDDNLRISELSIPGTHETMARFSWLPSYWCQSLRLGQQLRAGIRAVDIRCRHAHDRFAIHHADAYQYAWFGEPLNIPGHQNAGDESVVDTCIQFLLDNPTETIIMRIQHASDHDATREFWKTFEWYLEEDSCVIQDSVLWYKDFFWQDTAWSYEDSLPTLGDIRGKIFVLQEFYSPEDTVFGPSYPGGANWVATELIKGQDIYAIHLFHSDYLRKWNSIRNMINSARGGSSEKLYLNYTSGGMGPVNWPMWLAGGSWTPFVPYVWQLAWLGTWDVGMNARTMHVLRGFFHSNDLGRVGVIMMDYPGAGLIDIIIAQNGIGSYCLDDPPVADAGGPYESIEGSEIVFDASGSYDPEGSALQYRWHLWNFTMTEDSLLGDTIRIWDAADWSDTPEISYTFYDNDSCIAVLDVREVTSGVVVHDMVSVMVTNAPPVASIDSLVSLIRGCVLPRHEVSFYGSFVDPGAYDTHSAQWDFGDGTIEPDTLVIENDIPDATGSSFIAHAFNEAGSFEVVFEITDDDEGTGQSIHQLRVLTPIEVVDYLDSVIQSFPDSYFKKPATQRKAAFSNKCHALKKMIGAGDNTGGVTNKLTNDLRSKADGSVDGVSNNDWIIEDEAQQLVCLIIDELIIYIESVFKSLDLPSLAIQETEETAPTEFHLEQNYPNPFNPYTDISFTLPEATMVTIEIYNIMGQKVAVLIEGNLQAGEHTVTWNGTNSSSGIYFYRLNAGIVTETRKMILVK